MGTHNPSAVDANRDDGVSLSAMRNRTAVALGLLLAACSSKPRPAGQLVDFEWGFDANQPMTLPSHTEERESIAGPRAHWHVKAGGDDSANCVHVDAPKSQGEHFHLLLTEVPFHQANLRMAVRVRAEGGKEDQGGGLVWRAEDEQNYYITRWNPLEDNVRIYRVKGGERVLIENAKVVVEAPNQWHTLEVTARGPHHTVMFDGKTLFTIDDDTFAETGAVGLWTKADASTSFDGWKCAVLPN